MEAVVYTDGSALKNAKDAPAGWACYFVNEKVLKSGSFYGTNNIAELFAISYSLWYFINRINIANAKITIKTDSEYSIGVITGAKKAKANLKLINGIRKLEKELIKRGCSLYFEHVDAHTGGKDPDSIYNDKVDKAARAAATKLSKKAKTQPKAIADQL